MIPPIRQTAAAGTSQSVVPSMKLAVSRIRLNTNNPMEVYE
jgi:hypothetical protein